VSYTFTLNQDELNAVLKAVQELPAKVANPLTEKFKDTNQKAATSYKPTSGMATAAKRALKWKSEGKPGGTRVGLARANQLKSRTPLSESTVLRMFSFFSRHEPDKQATGFYSGQDGFPSKGRVAWDLWGGDGGFTWSRKKRDQIMRNRGKMLQGLSAKANIQQVFLNAAAEMVEQYARDFIAENLDAFGQYMYHAELLRNNHLDVYLMDLHLVDNQFRDFLIVVFAELGDEPEPGSTIDDEDSDEDTPT
jgi:hypothetical protein